MLSKFPLFLLLLSLSLSAQAQKQKVDNGNLIYTLGKDTTVIGNYQLNGNDFNMTIVVRTPSINVHKLKGTFFPNGELQFAEGYNFKPILGKDSQFIQSYKLYYERDSTFVEQKRNNGITFQKYPVKAMLVNNIGVYPILFLPALIANYITIKKGDSISSHHIAVGKARTLSIKRLDKRKLSIGSSAMGTFTLLFDQHDNLQYVDGVGSSWNLFGKAIPYLNMDSVIAANTLGEQASLPVGIINKLDSVQTTINSTSIKIRYSRPSVRGRVIFGEVVPWNRFWRTGANAATKITISQPLYFDGKELPPGEYSIFTMPTKNGWTMMFNKEANIWGTDYNPEFDVLRIPMKVEQLKEPVELMIIEVGTETNGGTMNVIWEKLKASVSFTTK